MEGRKTHLINEKGEKMVVETRNAKKVLQQLNESSNSKYHVDIDWYLNNGYVIAEDGFDMIENGSL